MKIARTFDAAILKSEMTRQQVIDAIRECVRFDSRTVCVRGCDIDLALEMTKGTNTGVSCVLDFPYGYGGIDAKAAIAEIYAKKGVEDIDMVMNYGYARGGDWELVQAEIEAVCEAAHRHGALVKVIFETSQLDSDQIRKATEVSIAAGADYVKTSTGFNGAGATVEAVQVMLETAKGRVKIKASGGIRNYETAKMYVDMGVDRLGVGYAACATICEGEAAAAQA
jgi:deoxyribose-phosphate aldolase